MEEETQVVHWYYFQSIQYCKRVTVECEGQGEEVKLFNFSYTWLQKNIYI